MPAHVSVFSNHSSMLNDGNRGHLRPKIAVATVSGKAYYELVTELNSKGLPFLSLKPWDVIPLDIKVVITTKTEQNQVSYSNILVFESGSKPETVVDKALMIVQGKQIYEKLVVGVDPGQACGIAVLGDNQVLDTLGCSGVEDAVAIIVECLNRFPAEFKLVRVGDGPSEYTTALLGYLNNRLPEDVLVEVVSEDGTSKLAHKSVNRRVLRDAVSAIHIAGRNGRIFLRTNAK
ncbi:MAG: hypothetical protein WC325_01280 [Candidatus Bathyarchaeia archaeon]|jgi:hypothetical protein